MVWALLPYAREIEDGVNSLRDVYKLVEGLVSLDTQSRAVVVGFLTFFLSVLISLHRHVGDAITPLVTFLERGLISALCLTIVGTVWLLFPVLEWLCRADRPVLTMLLLTVVPIFQFWEGSCASEGFRIARRFGPAFAFGAASGVRGFYNAVAFFGSLSAALGLTL